MEALSASSAGLPDSSSELYSLRAPRRAKTLRRRTLNHRIRLAAKRYHEEHPTGTPCDTHDVFCHLTDYSVEGYKRRVKPQEPSALRLHAEKDLHSEQRELQRRTVNADRVSYRRRSKAPWAIDEDEEVAFARGRVPLPSDRHRNLQRHPSLGREDAFCDASTYRGKVHVKRMPIVATDDDDAQIAELYRMGLLYDGDEQSQRLDATFNLNAIHHDEPIYSVRHARRGGRKTQHAKSFDGSLPLDISFSDLGNDDQLAQYLINTNTEEMDISGDDDTLQHTSRRSSQPTNTTTNTQAQVQAQAPLRVIYELATSRPSFDVDTSQPPDLMNDSLSDYDCFSDSDLDDKQELPSQREVHDAAAATSASDPWVLLGDDS